jgi:hypothetical protein
MTITDVDTLPAKDAVLSAVLSAVSVTQSRRSGLSTGLPRLGSLAASFSSLVPSRLGSRRAAGRGELRTLGARRRPRRDTPLAARRADR